MTLEHFPGAPKVDDQRDPLGRRARSNVRLLLCAIACSIVCGCGGGGGCKEITPGDCGEVPPCGDEVYYTNCPPTSPSATLLAVTNAASGTIDLLTIDTKTGVPTPVGGNPFPDGPAPSDVAIDSSKQFLYVSSTSGEVRVYLIDPSTLKLTPASGSPFATSAPAVAIAGSSLQFVVTANGSADTLSTFQSGWQSACGPCQYLYYFSAVGSFAAGGDPSAIVLANQILYAANTTSRSVSVYGASISDFTPVAGSPFSTAGSPNGVVIDPTGTHLYVTESQPNEVSGFSIVPINGVVTLTPIPGSPFAASYAIKSPVMDAAGKRLYAANGTDVDSFLVDSTTGALTEVGLSHTNGHAIALAMDGPDNFLYALDNVGNQLEVFSVAPADGSLTLITGSPFALFPGASSQFLGPNAIAIQQ